MCTCMCEKSLVSPSHTHTQRTFPNSIFPWRIGRHGHLDLWWWWLHHRITIVVVVFRHRCALRCRIHRRCFGGSSSCCRCGGIVLHVTFIRWLFAIDFNLRFFFDYVVGSCCHGGSCDQRYVVTCSLESYLVRDFSHFRALSQQSIVLYHVSPFRTGTLQQYNQDS